MNDKILKGIGIIFVAVLVVFLAAVIGGTILWSIYPHIHALFPNAAKNGIIAYDLNWWDSVCISWIFGLLVKGSSSYNSKSKD